MDRRGPNAYAPMNPTLSLRLSSKPTGVKEDEMRKVVVDEFMSLDGVAQAPGGPEEDPSGDFRHGGWQLQYEGGSDTPGTWALDNIVGAGGFLLGRRTYEIFAGYWPTAPDAPQAIAEPLNTKPKYVASRTLTEPLGWENSTLLEGELEDSVNALKQEDGGDLHVIGSTELVRGLLERDLVDELRLVIYPISLGGGKRFLPDDGERKDWSLVDSRATGGVIVATYTRR
jgi:dihydrofolate reductase